MMHVLILAGGRGVRMKTEGPKVLMRVRGRAMISHLMENVKKICETPSVIIGYQGQDVIDHLGAGHHFIWQKEQLGTGNAVASAKEFLENRWIKSLIVLYGDHPLVKDTTIKELAEARERFDAALSMGIVRVPNYENEYGVYKNYGRILRDGSGKILGSVEVRDATPEQKKIKEVNLSYYCFRPKWLWENISKLENNNAAHEYYLTDMAAMAAAQGEKVAEVAVDPIEGMGANSPEELSIIEKYL